MGTIAVEQRQYTTYILSVADSDALVEVIPERGGIVTRWQIGGREVFYLDAERLTNPQLSVRGGNPILFPICGNLPDNVYTHNGQQYTLKQHGFARELPWEVVEQVANDVPSLTLALISNDQTRPVYPFEFRLEMTYTLLAGNKLATHQRIRNHSAVPMPFAIGFHPYFAVTDKQQLEFAIPATELLDQRTKESRPFTGQFDFEEDEIDVCFRQISNQMAAVYDRSQALRLTLDYSQAFSTLVFWTVKGKDFYCLEPWTSGRNALNTGENLIWLEPGSSQEMDFTFTVETA